MEAKRQRSEVRDQMSEDSEETLEVGGALRSRLEAKRQRSDVRDQMSEGRGQKKIRSQRSEVRDQTTPAYAEASASVTTSARRVGVARRQTTIADLRD